MRKNLGGKRLCGLLKKKDRTKVENSLYVRKDRMGRIVDSSYGRMKYVSFIHTHPIRKNKKTDQVSRSSEIRLKRMVDHSLLLPMM